MNHKTNILIFVHYCTPETKYHSNKENGLTLIPCLAVGCCSIPIFMTRSYYYFLLAYVVPWGLETEKNLFFWQVASLVNSHLRCGVNKELTILKKTLCKWLKLDFFKIMKESSEVLMSSYAVHYLCTKQM